MILRNCLAVIGCVLALSGAAYSQAQGEAEKSNKQQQHSDPEQPKATSTQAPISGPTIQPQATNHAPAEAKIYEPDCGKPANQPDADLCTQRRVADAAEKALQYTLAQTIIGALGVAFVVVTLGFTARANKAAAIAAQAAVDAVGTERAWMSFAGCDSGTGPGTFDGQNYDHVLQAAFVWQNTGRSPAINAKITRSGIVRDLNPDDTSVAPYELSEHGNVIGPGIKTYANPFPIYGTDLAEFYDRKKCIWLFSRVEYETMHAPGVIRQTEVCGKVQFGGMRPGKDGSLEPVVIFTPVGERNIAD